MFVLVIVAMSLMTVCAEFAEMSPGKQCMYLHLVPWSRELFQNQICMWNAQCVYMQISLTI